MLDGAARVGEVVAAAAADGQPALGITDHGNMYGVLDFYKACRSQGIKPDHRHRGLHGPRAAAHERPPRRGRVDDTGGDADGGREALLPPDPAGRERRRLPQPHPALQPGLPRGLLLQAPARLGAARARTSEGVIATTGCLGGHVLQSLLQGDDDGALEKAGRLQDIFGRDNLFVELQDHGLAAQRRTNPQLLEIATRLGAPLLATNDSHYTHRERRRRPRRPAVRADRLAHERPRTASSSTATSTT